MLYSCYILTTVISMFSCVSLDVHIELNIHHNNHICKGILLCNFILKAEKDAQQLSLVKSLSCMQFIVSDSQLNKNMQYNDTHKVSLLYCSLGTYM